MLTFLLVRTYSSKLYLFSWLLVAYTVLVIVWGAWVRISGSGDGCGDHWPLCNGELVPKERATQTWIEFSHRLSTALYGILVLAQIIWVRYGFPKGHPARRWSLLVLVFTITEALIGAQLVLLGLVDQSVSVKRLLVMPLHLVNTSLLLFSCVMAAESIAHGYTQRIKLPSAVRMWIAAAAVALIVMLTSGAIASLGTHLAPSASLIEGLTKDISVESHPAVRLRILHPLLGLVLPLVLVVAAARIKQSLPDAARAHQWLFRLATCVLVTATAGIVTLTLLSPIAMKLTHLVLVNIAVIAASGAFFHCRHPSCEEHSRLEG